MEKLTERIKYIVINVLGGVKEVSEKLNLSGQAIRDYMNGKSYPRQDFLEYVIEQGISIDWLLTGRGDMQLQPKDTASEPHAVYLIAGEIPQRTKELIVDEQINRIEYLLKSKNLPYEAKKYLVESSLAQILKLQEPQA